MRLHFPLDRGRSERWIGKGLSGFGDLGVLKCSEPRAPGAHGPDPDPCMAALSTSRVHSPPSPPTLWTWTSQSWEEKGLWCFQSKPMTHRASPWLLESLVRLILYMLQKEKVFLKPWR